MTQKYRYNAQNVLVADCDRCNAEVIVLRMARLRNRMYCDGCYRASEKEAVNEWGIEFKRHMNGEGENNRLKKIITAPRLSDFLN
ncbi:MAG: hypothetical protein AABY22_15830 [Nanoarchaeota archaeon]